MQCVIAMFRFYPLFCFLLIFLGACSLQEKTPSSPEAFYKKALQYKEKSNYPKALETVTQLRQQFPYSSYNAKVRLLLGDIYFEQKKYSLAATVYKRSLLIHPQEQRFYVLNQLGLCHLRQLPSTPDRDISKADPALEYFQELINSSKSNPYKEEAKKQKRFLLDLKAKKEFIIASFYIKQGLEKAALSRLNHIIQTYPESSVISEALVSAYDLAGKLKKPRELYRKQLEEKFPHLLKTKNQKGV